MQHGFMVINESLAHLSPNVYEIYRGTGTGRIAHIQMHNNSSRSAFSLFLRHAALAARMMVVWTAEQSASARRK